MWSDERLNVRVSYSGGLGALCFYGKMYGSLERYATSWNPCRELQHQEWNRLLRKGIRPSNSFFHVPKDVLLLQTAEVRCDDTKTNQVVAFIDAFENRLGLKDRTSFGPTPYPHVVWVKPSFFWRRYAMRRSLFTALLRVGFNYDPDRRNFKTALYSKAYTSTTRLAVERFLAGYTVYCGCIEGWQRAFVRKTKEEVEKLLVNPEKVKHVG